MKLWTREAESSHEDRYLINFVLSIFCCCCGFQDAHFTSLLHFWLRSSILERNWQKCWSRHDNLIAFVILNLFVLPAKSHHIPQYNCNCIIDIFLPVFCAHASYLIPSHSSHSTPKSVSLDDFITYSYYAFTWSKTTKIVLIWHFLWLWWRRLHCHCHRVRSAYTTWIQKIIRLMMRAVLYKTANWLTPQRTAPNWNAERNNHTLS